MSTTITRPTLNDDTGDGESGDVANAAFIGTKIYDPMDAIFAAAAKCQVYNSAAQSIPNSTYTALTFNSEDHDTFGMHSTVTNTSRITIPTGGDGIYLVGGVVSFDANATGIRGLRILKNGTTDVCPGTFVTASGLAAGIGPSLNVHALVSLVAGDYLELFARQDSGGALNSGNAARVQTNQFFATRAL